MITPFRRFCLLLLLTVLGLMLWQPISSAAQSSSAWSDPVNLSQSGSVSAPNIAIDSTGSVHVVWSDLFAGTQYVRRDTADDGSITWSNTLTPEAAFNSASPQIISDNQGFLHAFWLGDRNALFYARAFGPNLGLGGGWTDTQAIAESALVVQAAVDGQGVIHVVYVRPQHTAELPSGVYYRRSTNGGQSFSPGQRLYESLYFRGLSAENTAVSISADANGRILAAWDISSRQQIYFTRSGDGGSTWDAAQEVTSARLGSISSSPYQPFVHFAGDIGLLIWLSGERNLSCAPFYQITSDGGSTWSEVRALIDESQGCASQFSAFNTADGLTILLTYYPDRIDLQAWNGSQWSKVQSQREIASFSDPVTLAAVELGCLQAAISPQNELVVVGCDRSTSQDIWALSRQLGGFEEWFPPPTAWNSLEQIYSSQAESLQPVMVAAGENRKIAIWSEPLPVQSSTGVRLGELYSLLYSVNEDGAWSPILTIPTGDRTGSALSQSVPGRGADQPDSEYDINGRLHLVWRNRESAEIHYSWINSENATTPAEWSQSITLPAPRKAASSPDILSDPLGGLWVTFAIPINEGRGIYLTRSFDEGASWSTPQLIFDAAAAGWEVVDEPQMALTLNGHLHILFTRYSLPGGPGSLGLYYSKSTDSGQTWSEPLTVTQNQVAWSRMQGAGRLLLHRAWIEATEDRRVLWEEFSLDAGLTWQRISGLASAGENTLAASLMLDPANTLHLTELIATNNNTSILRHGIFNGERWAEVEAVTLNVSDLPETGGLTSAITSDGQLTALFAYPVNLPGLDEAGLPLRGTGLSFTGRQYELPDVSDQPAITLESPPTETPTPTATPESLTVGPTPSPTVNFAAIQQDQNPAPAVDGTILGIIVGGILALAIVAGFLIWQWRFGALHR